MVQSYVSQNDEVVPCNIAVKVPTTGCYSTLAYTAIHTILNNYPGSSLNTDQG